MDGLREQLEEEQEARSDLQRQLSRSNAMAQEWRSKYETEGMARAEELEDAKRKLQARLAEAEQEVEAANIKVGTLFVVSLGFFFFIEEVQRRAK